MTAPPALPPSLHTALAAAAAAIGPDGDLPASARGPLYEIVDEAARQIHRDAGRYVRAKLALASAYASLPYLLDDELSAGGRSLTLATVGAMRGELDSDTLEEMYEASVAQWTGLLGSPDVDPRVVYALLACAGAAGTLLDDPDPEALSVPEKVADPSDWEPCFYASLACTGGAAWDGIGDPLVRRRFWEWYLFVAVPYAWDIGTPLDGGPPLPSL